MKVKVKEVKEEQGLIVLSIDGVDCAYFIQRPEPLTHADARLLQYAMDVSFLKSMTAMISTPSLFASIRRFFGFGKQSTQVMMVRQDGQIVNMTPGEVLSFFGPKVADFIRLVGMPLDVEGEECVVLTKCDVEKIEKGQLK